MNALPPRSPTPSRLAAADAPRIWMDGIALTDPHGTGITTYSRSLAAAVRASGYRFGLLFGRPLPSRLDPTEQEVRFFDAGGRPHRPLWQRIGRLVTRARGERARTVPLTGMVDPDLRPATTYTTFSTANLVPADELWNADDMLGQAQVQMVVTGRMLRLRAVGGTPPRLIHWTHAHPMRLEGALNVYTIHDLLPLRLPWAMPDLKRLWLRTARAIAATADHIVTVSENSRRDIIELLGVPEERVTNTYQPVSPPRSDMPDAMSRARLQGTYGLEHRGYYLFVSSIEPRKNVSRLVDAYLASNSQAPLILVGRRYSHSTEELRVLTQANGTQSRDGRIRHLGYIPRQDVEMLTRHARAMCFPSLYEGFGLPAAEAMQLGTPVLTSNNSSMPEIVGDAAITVDPTDTRALAEALVALDTDAELRERLSALGPPRAAMFSPSRYAERLETVHRKLGVADPGA
ncbi:MAG: glycosyltransferase family 4 protein [Acetobacteraceae bacterium]|nr:glycosyltransferase family 4 protein [Acetobacteraceae bacterium]